jgi:hypothetical protein
MELLTSKGFVRQWTLIDGHPVCNADALPPHDPGAGPAMQWSQAVLELCQEADVLAGAMRAQPPENGEPRQIQATDEDGELLFEDGLPVMIDNPEWALLPRATGGEEHPAWAAYDTAQSIIKSADPAAIALLSLREQADGNLEMQSLVMVALTKRADEIEPALPVPESVALWQARAALASAGLLEKAQAAIAAAPAAVSTAWEYGNTISRASPTIAALGEALGLSSAQIDDLFRQAAAIQV